MTHKGWRVVKPQHNQLFGTIPTPAYDLEVKVTDLEIYVKVLCQSFFKNS